MGQAGLWGSLGGVENDEQLWGNKGLGRKAESNVKKEEEKEHFGAEWGGMGGGSQGSRKGSLEESGRERVEEKEETGRVGSGWPEGRRGLRRRTGAWQIGGACGDGDQMATWVLPEQLCLYPQPCPHKESVLILLTEGKRMHKATA